MRQVQKRDLNTSVNFFSSNLPHIVLLSIHVHKQDRSRLCYRILNLIRTAYPCYKRLTITLKMHCRLLSSGIKTKKKSLSVSSKYAKFIYLTTIQDHSARLSFRSRCDYTDRSKSVADPGFVKREGRESKCRDAAPGLKKGRSAGGGGGVPWSKRLYKWSVLSNLTWPQTIQSIFTCHLYHILHLIIDHPFPWRRQRRNLRQTLDSSLYIFASSTKTWYEYQRDFFPFKLPHFSLS